MKSVRNLSLVALIVCVVSCREQKPGNLPTTNVGATNLQIFQAKGVIKVLKPDGSPRDHCASQDRKTTRAWFGNF